ncbi:MAG TPA: hypothetical protein VMW50_07845 [Dehalococcoidia bacterium]|nr:hypothetical protein [Dehalococcoidia bacterium]
MTEFTTSANSAIAAGSGIEIAGAFFKASEIITPNASSWTAIATASTAYLGLTPSGTAGTQILSAAWISTAPVWATDKQGWYSSAGSNIRAVASAYKAAGATAQSEKTLYNKFNIIKGTNWNTALAALLGAGWTTALASNLGTNWNTALADTLVHALPFYDGTLSAGDYAIRGLIDSVPISYYNPVAYTKIKEIKASVSGTLRIVFSLCVPTGTGYGKIYKNGSAVGTERTLSGSTTDIYSKFTEDIAVARGDLIQLYIKNSGSNRMYTDLLAICSDKFGVNSVLLGS